MHLGTVRDQAVRINRARVDESSRQYTVKNARDHVYSKGYAVTAKGIENMLSKDSRVPTLVRYVSSLFIFVL